MKCPICLAKYQNPKLLNCGHSFCQTCIAHVTTQYQGGRQIIKCAVCREITPVPVYGIQHLKNDFRLKSLQDTLTECMRNKSPWNVCKICQSRGEMTKTAGYWCFDCSTYFCTSCFQSHQQKLEGHFTTNTDGKFGMLICGMHGEISNYVCKPCRRFCCLTCIMTSC